MFNGFRGTAGGAVQTNYTDQPGIAYPGQIAFASDTGQMDAFLIGEAEGIACGKGVRLIANAGAEPGNLQRPDLLAALPAADSAEADFAGFLVFDEGSQSDANGVPGWNKGRNGRVLRNRRSGGRIYVKFNEAATVASTVNWVTVAGTDEKYAIGDIAPAALAGTAEAGTSVAISTAKVITGCAAGGIAIVELLGA